MDFYKYSPYMTEQLVLGLKAGGFYEYYSSVINRTRQGGNLSEKIGPQAFVRKGGTGQLLESIYIYWHQTACRVGYESNTYSSSVLEANGGSIDLGTDWPEVLAVIARSPVLFDPAFALLPVFDITKARYDGDWSSPDKLKPEGTTSWTFEFRFTKETAGDLILDYRSDNPFALPSSLTGGAFIIFDQNGTPVPSSYLSYPETPAEQYCDQRKFENVQPGQYRLWIRAKASSPSGLFFVNITAAEVVPERTVDTSADPAVEISAGVWAESTDGFLYETSTVEAAKYTRTDTFNPPFTYWDFYSLFENIFLFQELGADLLAASDVRLQITCDYESPEAVARANIYIATDIFAGFPATEAEYKARALSAGSVEWDMSAAWVAGNIYTSPNIRSIIPTDWTSGKNLLIVVKPVEFAENNYKEYKAKTAGQANAPRLIIS